SIDQCNKGQRDGLAMYYNQLPMEYRIVENHLTEFLDESVQKVLNDVFASQDLLKEITGLTTLSGSLAFEGSHQTLYLKNRLHLQVRLKKHMLEIDRHNFMIYYIIFKAPLKKVKEFFFKIFSPN